MKQVELIQYEHSYKVGDAAPNIEPNVVEDSLFLLNGEPIGFYMRKMPEKMCQIATLCDEEFRSKRVPKSKMSRSSAIKYDEAKGVFVESEDGVAQFSTIIGSTPPRPHMRRPYPSISSVHAQKSAEKFIKGMKLLAYHGEELIRELMPEVYAKQREIIEQNVPEKFRFGKLFTSSISNYNISADFHRDTGNLKECVNIIIVKKQRAIGGNTTVPDYKATVDSCDNSILVYPAWKNIHAVTPIIPTAHDGYRNSLVFYPLGSFKKYV